MTVACASAPVTVTPDGADGVTAAPHLRARYSSTVGSLSVRVPATTIVSMIAPFQGRPLRLSSSSVPVTS